MARPSLMQVYTSGAPRKLLMHKMPSQSRLEQYCVNFLPCFLVGQKNLLCQSTEVNSNARSTGRGGAVSLSDPALRAGTNSPRAFRQAHGHASAPRSSRNNICFYQVLDKKTEAAEARDLFKDTGLMNDLPNSMSVFSPPLN